VLSRKDTVRNALDRQDAKNERARPLGKARSSARRPGAQHAALRRADHGAARAAHQRHPRHADGGDVDELVQMSNATRQFRFAPAVQQESLLAQLRGQARADPTKVDVQMLTTLQGIYDGQQRQLKESGIKFVVSQGLVAPTTRPWRRSTPPSPRPWRHARRSACSSRAR
jgi:hypothetical protein